ncbi:Zn-ribbon domain-containing OB-fold protein [Salinirubellus sp. GCM10025818]|uniref:Zn-ribbon domain-containing OB-fold protein n=1 Tax=Salinirubellus TaxID=2162630 RepID=UPI0030CC1929
MSETEGPAEEAGSESEDGDDLPELTFRTWSDALRSGRLLGQACPDCGHVAGAPKAACARCGSRAIETVELPTTGEVYTETTVMVPPEGVEERGYQVAIVRVGEARVMGRIEGEEVAIGDELRLAGYVRGEEDDTGPLFEPV